MGFVLEVEYGGREGFLYVTRGVEGFDVQGSVVGEVGMSSSIEAGAFVCRGGVEIAKFSATNREIGVFPRRTAKSTIFRDKSRYNLFSATDREISCLCKLKFRSLDLFQRNLTKRYKI